MTERLFPPQTARRTHVTVPYSPVEEIVARAFEEVLGVPVTARDADFFELGGDSFLAVTAGLILEDAFQIELPVDLLEEVTTVAAVAAWIEARR
jgi:acyl carrier protein